MAGQEGVASGGQATEEQTSVDPAFRGLAQLLGLQSPA